MQNPGQLPFCLRTNNYFAIFNPTKGLLLLVQPLSFMEYDLSMLKALVKDDDQFIIDFLTTFKLTSAPIIRHMLDFESQNKYDALGREAHKLIPGVSFLGVASLKDVLIHIEEGAKNGTPPDKMHAYVTEAARMVEDLIQLFEKDFNLDPGS